ncbi:branched-chain amino acid ABC transporter permease [Haloferax sulfurifontis]|uniref:Branched-chain amino acid ABC transporter permease n=2 Tax=Haloferax sulfurifontis TaxID=255616 RepID=M0HVV0_9EURY|nr:branched-chain amino acid ABC transporter permease [Haloferax sulfurifontis]ELZ88606.1 branched-chain amino acid ABC transporter permease [Haloferax sulfurifontis ATCC BAA-897]GGC67926.1 branched-chain amino acid ABC transporter permease [Haloferax sulfurifontis]
MGHLVTSVAPLPLQGGGLGRFIDPFAQFLTDITNLEPVLLQLLAFGLLLGGVYALTALGLTMIFGVMDVINFAHGIFLVVGMYSVWLVSETAGISPFLGIPIAAAVLFALGVVVHILTVEPIIEAPQQNQLIATLGVLFIIQSAVEILFTPDPQQVELSLGSVQVGDVFIPLGQFYALVIALGTMLAVRAFLNRTDLGRKIRGTADNRDGARYVGINVRRINYLTFGIGAALAGVAGGSIALFQRFDPFTGETYLINAFVIVILGGLGSFPGAFVGGLIVGLIQVFGGYYLPGTTAQVLIFLLFIGTLLVKPEGLFGGAEA